MAVPETAGRVVVLNGSSSAGKSSLALELQSLWEARGECWVIFSWDDFIPRLPARWRGVPGAVGDLADEGSRYRIVDSGGDVLTAVLEPGAVGRRMLRAYHRAIAAVAHSGIDVVVEEVMMTTTEWEDWRQALDGLQVRWAGIRCDLDVVGNRERARGDRHVGLARGTGLVVHRYATYDVEIDTTWVAAADAAVQLDSLLAATSFSPGA
jgi:chloramphenicol 3-O phosphotransferase